MLNTSNGHHPRLVRYALVSGLAAILAMVSAGCGAQEEVVLAAGQTLTSLPTDTNPGVRDVRPSTHRVSAMGKSLPVRVIIPAIEVDSQLMSLGLETDGTLEVPPDAFPAGWYTGAPTPGEVGPAIIAGHVRWDGDVGVFADLGELRPANIVLVTRADATTAVFQVTHIEQYVKSRFPTDAVYGNTHRPTLRLITCGGYDSDTGDYDTNVVAFATLVASRAA